VTFKSVRSNFQLFDPRRQHNPWRWHNNMDSMGEREIFNLEIKFSREFWWEKISKFRGCIRKMMSEELNYIWRWTKTMIKERRWRANLEEIHSPDLFHFFLLSLKFKCWLNYTFDPLSFPKLWFWPLKKTIFSGP